MGLSIAAGITLYSLVSRSPYVLGIVLILGVYLAAPSTIRVGAVLGAIISLPLGLYFAFTNAFGPGSANSILGSLLDILLVTAFGALYGATLVWIRGEIVGGTSFN